MPPTTGRTPSTRKASQPNKGQHDNVTEPQLGTHNSESSADWQSAVPRTDSPLGLSRPFPLTRGFLLFPHPTAHRPHQCAPVCTYVHLCAPTCTKMKNPQNAAQTAHNCTL